LARGCRLICRRARH